MDAQEISRAASSRCGCGLLTRSGREQRWRQVVAEIVDVRFELRQPAEPAWRIPIALAEKAHCGWHHDGPDDCRVDEQGTGVSNPICWKETRSVAATRLNPAMIIIRRR
jgi:hypothetical protein